MVKLATCKAEDADKWMGYRRLDLDYEPGTKIVAEVYTNQPEAELFAGERSLGVKRDKAENGRFAWELTYTGEPLKAIARGMTDTGDVFTITDVLQSAGEPASLELSLWESELEADGRSVGQIEIRVLDSDGYVIKSNEDMIEVTVEGEARLLHMDNGDLGDTTPYRSNRRKAHGGCLMAYIVTTGYPGEVTITAKKVTEGSEIQNTISLRTI